MTCDAWSAKLDAYVDSELPAEQMEALHSHLRGCPSCTSQMAERLQLKRAIGIAGRQFSPSAELRRKVQKQVGKPQKVRWGWLVPAAVAAVLLLAIFFNLRIGNEAPPQFREIADLHVAALAGSNPVDVTSTDRHTVKPWYAGKLGFSPPVADYAAEGFALVGGRLDSVDGDPVAALVYRHDRHMIDVFVWPADSAASSSPARLALRGHNLLHWSFAGMNFWAISDLDASELAALQRLMSRARVM